MASYSGKSKRIKNALKIMLTAVQYDAGSGGEAAFTSVLDNTRGEFDGYPAARILPADLTTTKASVGQNDRSVNFIVVVTLPLEDSPETEAATFDKMYDLTDLIIDTLDQGDFIGAVNTADPTIGTYILNATRGDWMVVDTKAGLQLTCDVNVEVKYSKELY